MATDLVEILNPTTVRLWAPYPHMEEWREGLKVYREGAKYTKAYQKGWDGYVRPGRFRKIDGDWSLTLGRGMLTAVLREFGDLDVEVRYDPGPPLDLDRVLWGGRGEMARDYQIDALRRMSAARWGRIALATNAGKGLIIALAAEAALPRKTLILADEKSVFGALQEEIETWADADLDLVEAGRKDPPEGDVVLAMVPTLRERLKRQKHASTWGPWIRTFHQLLADEADRATSKSWKRVLRACETSEFRFGFSGSFPRERNVEDLELDELIGPTLIDIRNEELVEREISARPMVELYPYQAPSIPTPERGWDSLDGPGRRAHVYEHAVTENRERHRLIRSMLDEDAPNAVIVERIRHGEILEEFLPDATFLHGEHSREEREDALRRFREGEFRVLVATRILDRGTNLLGMAVGLIFASGAGSSRQTLQRVGRGLRRGGGKEFVFLRDVMDRGHRYLEKAAARRARVYQEENFDIRVIKEGERAVGSLGGV